jgi:hypothetical protein
MKKKCACQEKIIPGDPKAEKEIPDIQFTISDFRLNEHGGYSISI